MEGVGSGFSPTRGGLPSGGPTCTGAVRPSSPRGATRSSRIGPVARIGGTGSDGSTGACPELVEGLTAGGSTGLRPEPVEGLTAGGTRCAVRPCSPLAATGGDGEGAASAGSEVDDGSTGLTAGGSTGPCPEPVEGLTGAGAAGIERTGFAGSLRPRSSPGTFTTKKSRAIAATEMPISCQGHLLRLDRPLPYWTPPRGGGADGPPWTFFRASWMRLISPPDAPGYRFQRLQAAGAPPASASFSAHPRPPPVS